MRPDLDMQDPGSNRLFCCFSSEERMRLRRSMRGVYLELGQVLYEAGERQSYVYFPTTSIVSCLHTTHDGMTAEISLTGNDGVVGVASFLGGGNVPHRSMAQIEGGALRIPARALQEEFALGGNFQQLMLRYTQALITQIAQTAVCNRLHSLEQRLCRWLLLCHDRVNGSEIRMTQEFIANMLGGRRESVTVAAGHLQDLGLIRYSRGHIHIVDRGGLQANACECYQIVADEFSRLLATAHKQVEVLSPRRGAGVSSF